MSDNPNLGFTKFVPGFDFLQNLAKGASQSIPQMPNLSAWIAPTLSVEELDKRIGELKAVQFWLEQNSRALGATVQALEVQKMTLATLQGMNFNMGEVANALQLKTADMMGSVQKDKAQQAAEAPAGPADGAPRATRARPAASNNGNKAAKPTATGLVDPMQWWGALTQQFQQIAADALKDAARSTAVDAAGHMASGMAKDAMKGAAEAVRAATPGAGAKPARKAATRPRKTAARKAAAAR